MNSMFVGRVIGEVWATKKVDSLRGHRLLVIDPLRDGRAPTDARTGLVVAADPLGAGVGERVVVAFGRAARAGIGLGHDVAIEAAVVGIVDDADVDLS
jgi:ethanolamine utilization protein EutN